MTFAFPRLALQDAVSTEHFEQLSIRPRPIEARSYFEWNELIAAAARAVIFAVFSLLRHRSASSPFGTTPPNWTSECAPVSEYAQPKRNIEKQI
ncbi:hypothetical protein PENTCL1PPCAC_8055 [Pristionchus entomophagus]|uniref:Uncharacterized protein n=1 Tax=Pristionchus entomophagus TaxID=358040 RepID=A0AAV5SS42_9BILA|nr:hypothetical protein PENTCL1PPCAC_8055 [Pristionchus entomophagus]